MHEPIVSKQGGLSKHISGLFVQQLFEHANSVLQHLCPWDQNRLKSKAAGCKLTPTPNILLLHISPSQRCVHSCSLPVTLIITSSHCVQVETTTESWSGRPASPYPAALWARGIGFVAKISRLPQMTAKRSVSYKRKQDLRLSGRRPPLRQASRWTARSVNKLEKPRSLSVLARPSAAKEEDDRRCWNKHHRGLYINQQSSVCLEASEGEDGVNKKPPLSQNEPTFQNKRRLRQVLGLFTYVTEQTHSALWSESLNQQFGCFHLPGSWHLLHKLNELELKQ